MVFDKYLESINFDEVNNCFNMLSKRQWDILKLLSFGLTRKEIADALGISVNTVVTHISYLYYNLGVTNAHGAVGLWKIWEELKGSEN